MATTATPMPIAPSSQEAVVRYLNSALDLYSTSYNIRQQLQMRDAAYSRTKDLTTANTRARQANATGDASKLQNVTVPVVMPQVESALAYLTGVFLTGFPIFGVVAPPEQQDAMGMMETLIGENSVRTGWPLELMKTLRKGLKYNLGAVEVVWKNQKIFNIETPEMKDITNGKPVESYYQGNFITDLDPYNLILDTRVEPAKNHLEGEYAGYTEMLSRIETKKRMENLDPLGTMNFKKAFESPSPGIADSTSATAAYYLPQINPDALLPNVIRAEHNWLNWAGLAQKQEGNGIAYSNSYEYTTLYCRILPSDFGMRVPNSNHVQIWKFIVINRSVCIFAERQTNAHNYLPIIVCVPANDGLGWQTKSFAENAIPIQDVASGLWNSAMESQRRKVYDRLYYDPSRINKKDIENVSSVARIPVKNSAFGKTLQEAIYSSPYNDSGVAETLGMAAQVTQMGDIVNGQNRVQQGQFQKGNKTRTEFESVMSNSNSRQQMSAIALEYSFFVPIKEIIKSNILQYQQPKTVMNPQSKMGVQIDPTVLRKSLVDFTLSDGLLPTEKLADTGLFAQMLQIAPTVPSFVAEYDLMGMLTYYFKLQGAHWLSDFKRTPEQMQQYMQTMMSAGQAAGSTDQPEPPVPDAGAQGAT